MTVLVTGATGFIGYEVVRRLSDERRPVRALVRRMPRAALLNPFEVDLRVGDLSSPDSLRRACHGVQAVVHLAARATFEPYAALAPTIVDGSVALLDAAADAGVPRFVFGSSLMVYGDQPGPAIGPATPAAPEVDYGRAKLAAEQRLAARARERGVALAIIRLPHVYGARDLMFSRFHRRVTVLPGLAADAYAHLHVVDAARALIAVAREGWTGTSPIGDGGNDGWDRFFSTLRRYYPHHRVVRVPAALAEPGAALLAPLMALRGGPQLVTRDTVRSASLRQPVEPGLVWDDLGLRPRYPDVETGVPAALDEFVAYRWVHPVADRLA